MTRDEAADIARALCQDVIGPYGVGRLRGEIVDAILAAVDAEREACIADILRERWGQGDPVVDRCVQRIRARGKS